MDLFDGVQGGKTESSLISGVIIPLELRNIGDLHKTIADLATKKPMHSIKSILAVLKTLASLTLAIRSSAKIHELLGCRGLQPYFGELNKVRALRLWLSKTLRYRP